MGSAKKGKGGVAIRAAMLLLLVLVAPAGPTGPYAAAGAPPPGDDALVSLARDTGRILIADFGLGMCMQCRNQAAILEKVKDAYGDRVVVRMVPVNKEQGLVALYGVETIPHLVFLDPAGEVRFRRTGVMSFDDIAAQLRRMGVPR
ncbi:MAG: thioredoxin family protein [Deltaproteobacteria bacterium]